MPGRVEHFQRTNQPARVLAIDRGGGLWVDPFEFREQGVGRQQFQPRPKIPVAGRAVEHPVTQGAQVQPAPTDHQWRVAVGLDGPHRGHCQIGKSLHVKGFGDLANIDQVMGHPGLLGSSRFCRANVHPAIHLHRVGRHDLAVHLPRQLQRHGGLPDRGRAHDENRLHRPKDR